jgi:hypothetical protein
MVPTLSHPWQLSLLISFGLWFLYWDNNRPDVKFKHLMEISGCVYGVVTAVIACIAAILEKTCLAELDEVGFLFIGGIWRILNLLRILKETILPSQPH